MTRSREGLLSTRPYLRTQRAAVDYCNEVVDGAGRLQYLDKVGSVSALIEPSEPIWVDSLIDQQYRRFLNEVAL